MTPCWTIFGVCVCHLGCTGSFLRIYLAHHSGSRCLSRIVGCLARPKASWVASVCVPQHTSRGMVTTWWVQNAERCMATSKSQAPMARPMQRKGEGFLLHENPMENRKG